jgi:hypothetical protein
MMSISQSELDSFHSFASYELATTGAAESWPDLLAKWQAQREHNETVSSIRRGVQDAEAGRVRDLTEIDNQIRSQLGFPPRNK